MNPPIRARLLDNGRETTNFGPFTDDMGTFFPYAAIWQSCSGSAFTHVLVDYENGDRQITGVSGVWLPSGGDVGFEIGYWHHPEWDGPPADFEALERWNRTAPHATKPIRFAGLSI